LLFSPDGRYLLATGLNRTITVWALPAELCNRPETHPTSRVTEVAIRASDLHGLVIYRGDATVCDLALQTGRIIRRHQLSRLYLKGLHASGCGHYAVTSSNAIAAPARLWNMTTFSCIGRLGSAQQSSGSLFFHPRGTIVASKHRSREREENRSILLRIWSVPDCNLLGEVELDSDIGSVALVAPDNALAVLTESGRLAIVRSPYDRVEYAVWAPQLRPPEAHVQFVLIAVNNQSFSVLRVDSEERSYRRPLRVQVTHCVAHENPDAMNPADGVERRCGPHRPRREAILRAVKRIRSTARGHRFAGPNIGERKNSGILPSARQSVQAVGNTGCAVAERTRWCLSDAYSYQIAP